MAASFALLLLACSQVPVSPEPPAAPAPVEDLAGQALPNQSVHIYALEADAVEPGIESVAQAAAPAVITSTPQKPVLLPNAYAPEPVAACEVQPAPSIYYFQDDATLAPEAAGSLPRSAPAIDPEPELQQALPPPLAVPAANRNVLASPGSNAVTVGRVPPAAAASFTIGAGDTVQIDVLGRPELSARGSVSDDGQVTAALIGVVAIAGLTPAQAGARIAERYRTGQYLVSPQVTVTIVDYQSQLLTVLGEVGRPGRFPIRTRLSVLDALALSGGITELGSSLAYLLRPEDSLVTRYEIDLDALIQAGAGQQYFELFAGDILVVPKAEVFYIYGEVRNPNSYKIRPGITVIQALSLAGGLTDKGSDRRIDIRRQLPDGSLQSMAASLNDPLRADDVIYVRERLF